MFFGVLNLKEKYQLHGEVFLKCAFSVFVERASTKSGHHEVDDPYS